MCIEDDPSIALLVRTCLTQIGLEIRTVNNGVLACQILDSNPPPDCLLVDLMLPGMSGIEVIQHVRSTHRFEHMPIVIISANVCAETRSDARDLGVGHFLTKPFELEDLEALVTGVIIDHA